MAAMRAVGTGHQRTARAKVLSDRHEYVIELDVAAFAENELSVEAFGPTLTVRGNQLETPGDAGKAFRLHERLEESFRLPDDADPDQIKVCYGHRALEIRVPRKRGSSRAGCRSSIRLICSTPTRKPAERRKPWLSQPRKPTQHTDVVRPPSLA